MKIPIVTKEWVEAVWQANLKNFVKADDSMFSKYKASVFLNLIVTSTNLPKRQKEEIKRLINSNGGVKYIFLNSFFLFFFYPFSSIIVLFLDIYGSFGWCKS